jgi:hypothetical protein
MKLTYKTIVEAVQALNSFNPQIAWKTNLRLDRNLRKLDSAANEFQFLRNRIQWQCKKDKSKPANRSDGSAELTPEEHLEFSEKLEKLFAESAEVDIHPIELINSEQNQAPTDPEFFVDESANPMPRSIRATLREVIFTEWAGKVNGEHKV